jgi:hypothetical protein
MKQNPVKAAPLFLEHLRRVPCDGLALAAGSGAR